jgi:capsular polysaccharide biosynthesis protein
VSLILALGAFFYTKFFVPKTYKTSVKLCVSVSYDSTSGYDGLQSYNYAQRLVSTYIEILDTNSYYSTVAKELNDKYTASQLSSKISFQSVDSTDIFEAVVRSNSPSECKSIADAVAATAPDAIANVSTIAKLQIVDDAVVPKTPTSPNVNRNTALAFIVGLVLSIFFAFMRDYFDVKIKYDEDMTTICNLPVLAAVPDFEAFANGNKKTSDDPYNV